MQADWVAVSMPAEFEHQAAIVLGFNELLPYGPQLLMDVASALVDRIALIGIVRDEEQRRQAITLLCDWGLPAHLIHFVCMPVASMWVRDYGPGMVRMSRGTIALVDADYTFRDRTNDDKVPSALASLLRLPVIRVPLALEGGNLLSNGRGFCLTSLKLFARNRDRGYSEADVQNILTSYYGFREGMTLTPLYGEKTSHVDMFATFVSPTTVVIGQYDPAVDPVNASILNENARLLEGLPTSAGPLRVVRIPMPSNRGGIFATYTNVIYANGRLLMPSYPHLDAAAEEKAVQTYTQLLPGWEIIRIDCSKVIQREGALRCMSINIPWLTDRFPTPSHRRIPLRNSVILSSGSN